MRGGEDKNRHGRDEESKRRGGYERRKRDEEMKTRG